MTALDHKQWTTAREVLVLSSGNFSFVIGVSLRAASIRAGRKQIRVPTLSNMNGRGMVALGNSETVTARFAKVRLPSMVPFEVWSSQCAFSLLLFSFFFFFCCCTKHFRNTRFFEIFGHENEYGVSKVDLFSKAIIPNTVREHQRCD